MHARSFCLLTFALSSLAALALPPAAHAHSIISSPGIECACREHVTFIARPAPAATLTQTARVPWLSRVLSRGAGRARCG
jgi:hypothetical protein